MFCSIVIPVYYNEGTLGTTFLKIKDTVGQNSNVSGFEVIFIDDGSKDNSIKEILDLKDKHPNVKVIQFTRNFGQVSAIYAGYKLAKGDITITLSADLQDPPELIDQMINEYIQAKVEIVICSRQERDEGFFRRTTSRIFYRAMQRLAFKNMPSGGFDFVLLSRKVVDYIIKCDEINPFWQGQILWSGYSIKFIPYTRKKREIGSSRWTFGKKLKYLIDGILGYSFLPIRLISLVGILIFLGGIIYAIIILVSYFFGDTPFKGWAPIMILILLLSGFQLLMLGIIGEYLWRTMDQIRKRPNYIIDKTWE